jgi:hypothetical protein
MIVWKKRLKQRAENSCCIRCGLLVSADVKEFQITEDYSSLDITWVEYNVK